MAWDWDKLQQQKRGRQGGTPPRMDDVLEKIKNMRGKFRGSWIIIILLLVLIIGYSMVYTVAVDEVGVVQRFGKYKRTTSPGLNFKLPSGIEKITKVKVRYVYKEEFGFRTEAAGVRTVYSKASFLDESLMLTGDLNAAEVEWMPFCYDAKLVAKHWREPGTAVLLISQPVYTSRH